MNFDEFQHQARLYVVGALDAEDAAAFEKARAEFGLQAEQSIDEFRHLGSAFALSLRPQPARPETKLALLAKIKAGLQRD